MFLFVILVSIINEGKNAFKSTYIKLDINFDEKTVDPEGLRNIAVSYTHLRAHETR